MKLSIILLCIAVCINAMHINYIFKNLLKRIETDRDYILHLKEEVYTILDDFNYRKSIEIQKLINDIKSGKLKKETNKKK